MVKRCMAPGCSNTHSHRVSLFKLLSDAIYNTSGKTKYSGHELSRKLPNTWLFVVTILLRTVLRSTRHLLLSLGWTKGAGWSLEQFRQYSHDHPWLRYALVSLRRDHLAKEQQMLVQWLVMRVVGGILKSKCWVDFQTVLSKTVTYKVPGLL